MKIYEYQAFPNPRRVRMFLAEKGIDGITFEQVNVPEGEHRTDAFKAKNPSATVPLLELDDGAYIGETTAISRYFETVHPEPALMGRTPKEQAAVDMWQRRVEDGLMNAVGAYFHHATPGLGALESYQNKEWGEKNRDRALATMRWLDQELADRQFIAGERFSIADITALCGIDYARFCEIGIPAAYTNLQRWYDQVSSRPSAGA